MWENARKSRTSFANGNCVVVWENARKPEGSIGAGQCVVVSEAPAMIGVSDSQDDSGLVLAFTSGAWREFVDRYMASRVF